ncbi:hypothetical protein FRX31_016881, partial [Thalictrum thalictroides]
VPEALKDVRWGGGGGIAKLVVHLIRIKDQASLIPLSTKAKAWCNGVLGGPANLLLSPSRVLHATSLNCMLSQQFKHRGVVVRLQLCYI